MYFENPLIEGTLIKRYKRFLADVRLTSGETLTAHTPNTGSMLGCSEPGSRVWLSRATNPARKYPYSWEIVEAAPKVLVGINTALPNRLVIEAIENGVVQELQGYSQLRTEVRYGEEDSRVDILLGNPNKPERCYVEVKNVTAAVDSGIALFPDAVSLRARKHLRELTALRRAGQRAVIFFCVQRIDVSEVRPADSIDPAYGQTLRAALAEGVEALAYRADVSPSAIALRTALPVVCPILKSTNA